MKKTKQSFLEKHIDMKKTPFLALWAAKEEAEILKSETHIRRKGIPKGTAYPMPWQKRLLALSKAFCEFKLKDFAQGTRTSYAVVRVWAGEKRSEQLVSEYRTAFIATFLAEIGKPRKPPEENVWSIDPHSDFSTALIQEFAHYHHTLKSVIYDLVTSSGEVYWSFIGNMLLKSYMGFRLHNPPKTPRRKKLFEESIRHDGEFYRMLTNAMFEKLKKMVGAGKLADFDCLIESVRESVLHLIEDNTYLKLSVINRGRKIKTSPTT
jgi:hypothetical protein